MAGSIDQRSQKKSRNELVPARSAFNKQLASNYYQQWRTLSEKNSKRQAYMVVRLLAINSQRAFVFHYHEMEFTNFRYIAWFKGLSNIKGVLYRSLVNAPANRIYSVMTSSYVLAGRRTRVKESRGGACIFRLITKT